MPVESCSVAGCEYRTNDYAIANALEALRIHCRGAHPENFTAAAASGTGAVIDAQRREKPRRPTLHLVESVCEPQDWEYFIQCWESYKAMCSIDATNANVFFRDALPDEVGRMLHSTYGPTVTTMSEANLIVNTKNLIVVAKSKYAYIVEMEGMRQQTEERAEAFLARLKNKARQIGFKQSKDCTCDPPSSVEIDYSEDIVLNKFLAGLDDDEIKEDLMKEANLTLAMAARLVTTHEMAKRSRAMLAGGFSRGTQGHSSPSP